MKLKRPRPSFGTPKPYQYVKRRPTKAQRQYRKKHWNPSQQPTISGRLHRNRFAYFPDIRYVSQSQVKRHLGRMLDHLNPLVEGVPGAPLAIVDGLRGEVVAVMMSPEDAWELLLSDTSPYEFRQDSFEDNKAQLAIPVWDLDADKITRTLTPQANDPKYYSAENRRRRRALWQLRQESKADNVDNNQPDVNTDVMNTATNLPDLFPTEESMEILPDCPACVRELNNQPLFDEEGNEVFHETLTKHHPTEADLYVSDEIVSEQEAGVDIEEEAGESVEDEEFDPESIPSVQPQSDPDEVEEEVETPAEESEATVEVLPEPDNGFESDIDETEDEVAAEDEDEVLNTDEPVDEAVSEEELAAVDQEIAEVVARPACQVDVFKSSTLCMRGDNQEPGVAVARIRIPEVNTLKEADVCQYHFDVLGHNFELEILEQYAEPVSVPQSE